jgi:hypothetical protein
MGSGSYSTTCSTNAKGEKVYGRSDIKLNAFYMSAGKDTIFKQRQINNAMNPHGIVVRESRDSKEHPKSLAIVLALDVTGSMGTVPHYLVKEGLPNIMGRIIESDVDDPQVLFMGIGDHECDSSPLQVGQFESSDALLDKWLTDLFLEGGGGGNEGESYLLAWYLAGKHTSIDCWEKRKQKGFLFTIGDEPCLRMLPKSVIQNIMGDGQYSDCSSFSLLERAREKYNVFHVHIKETGAGSRRETIDGWIQVIGKDNLIIAERHEDVSKLISDKIVEMSEKSGKPGKGKEEIIL